MFTRLRRFVPLAVLPSLLLLGAAVGAPASAMVDDPGTSARVSSADRTYEGRCHRQGFRYDVDVNGNDWSLELLLLDPDGENVASAYKFDGGHPDHGRGSFRLCMPTLEPGRYTIKTKLSWYDPAEHVRWLEPRTFRLRRG